jgi:DNA-binding MarR family transcriptional regulator
MTPANLGRKLEGSATHLLHRATQCATELFAAEAGKDGLTARQFAILATIAENEGVSQTGLVQRTGIDRSTLADVIRRMISKGLILRKRTKDDARAYAVRLSEKGWRVLETAEPGATKADQRLLAGLSSAERKQFVDNLEKLISAVEAKAQR